MADRVLVWYIDELVDDQFSLGPVYIADVDYIPRVVRVHSKRTPGADIVFDIRDDGSSIFVGPLPTLLKSDVFEDVVADFDPDASTIAKYSLLSLHLISGGTGGLTVQLELVAVQDDEVDETDT